MSFTFSRSCRSNASKSISVQIDTFGTPHLDEDIIKRLFIKALNILVRERDIIIAGYEEIRDTAFSTEGLNVEVEVPFCDSTVKA